MHGALAWVLIAAASVQFTPNCADPQSNLEMKLCAQREFEAADKDLNTVYAEAVKAAREQDAGSPYSNPPNLEAALRDSQSAWVAFRDSNCNYQQTIYYGGSMASLAYVACKTDMTKARVKELKTLLNGGEEPPPPQP